MGTPDISLFEMVGAYSTFANKGIYVKPITITRIEDKNGTVLFEVSPETRDVISEESAYVTLNLLKGVTEGVQANAFATMLQKRTTPIRLW